MASEKSRIRRCIYVKCEAILFCSQSLAWAFPNLHKFSERFKGSKNTDGQCWYRTLYVAGLIDIIESGSSHKLHLRYKYIRQACHESK